LAEEGIRLETTAVGDRHVLERMREGNFSLGGENSGHIIFSDFASTGDGIVSALMVLAVIQTSGKTLSELAGDMSEYPQLLVNMAVREKPPLNEVPELQKAIDEAAALLGEDGRTLVRYSGTEKKIRVLVEAKEQGLVESQSAAIIAAVQKTIC
jgi:phosphoglucosamine mutase